MQNGPRPPIPKIAMDTSDLPEHEQFAYWAAHSSGARLVQLVPGPFLARGDLWNLGAMQIALVDIDPFVAIRDRALVNAVDVDYLQLVQLLDGAMRFEAGGATMELAAPVSFLRDYGQPSTATSTRMRCLILYFAREFLEEAVGPIGFQGPLAPVSELALLTTIALAMIGFFPAAAATSAPLYATVLRDLTAAAMASAGATSRGDRLSSLARAKCYVAAQPPGTLTVAGATEALGMSRSVLYRLFERDGGLLAYDRTRRLRAVHRALCNPLNTSTLADLAHRYGFRDQTALSRSFRLAFGSTPSDLRQRRASPAPFQDGRPPEDIRRSLEEME
jgi:AraC-like DNA-binding protein